MRSKKVQSMKVNAHSPQTAPDKSKPQRLSKEELQARVAAKFGKSAEVKKLEPKPDTVELNTKGVKNSGEEDFGDIGKNDPSSEVTREKLKSILKNGGFDFNDRERKALGQILN